jgi:hypothetical protein
MLHLVLVHDAWSVALTVTTGGSFLWSMQAQYRWLSEALSDSDDMQVLGLLLESIHCGGNRFEILDELRLPLTKRLLCVKPGDAELLEDRHHEILRRFLLWGERSVFHPGDHTEAELKIAALHALATMGDTWALGAVEKLAQSNQPPLVRRKAQECLSTLRDQEKRAEASLTLLRSTNSPPEQTLLHPASYVAQDDTVLLRSATATRAGQQER